MDIAATWRRRRTDPAQPPTPGTYQAAAGEGITITVAQQCQVAVPPVPNLSPDEVTVTVTSQRPGVAAQVTVGANVNSPDGGYQGPTTTVGHGGFTATSGQVEVGFVVLPSGWPVLGVGAEAVWDDGAEHSVALTYVELACDPWVWWRWPIRLLEALTLAYRNITGTVPPGG